MNILDPEFGVPTSHLKRTMEFYVQKLCFEKALESSHTGTVALGKHRVTFRKAHRDEVRSLRDLGFGLDFRIPGIHDYYHRVKMAGINDFQQELELMQPGVWQFSVLDPDGFPVGFAMSAHGKTP